jgi:hypothetical protein
MFPPMAPAWKIASMVWSLEYAYFSAPAAGGRKR